MTAYVCVHGHAYQPPRESPETGDVPEQPTAAPFHDWNERVTSECYSPMAQARILGPRGITRSVVNLWGEISFDLGPTLGAWMDRHATEVATAIATGDAQSEGAMAHPWVHAILPLTPSRDRATIVRWGIDEFVARFGRAPQGMWLPETAVDSASLETLVDAGIAWTMLAPHQLRSDEPLTAPTDVCLPSGRSITVVPYDGELSHGVAFGALLDDGVAFADAVTAHAEAAAGADPLIVVSTDAETFGHHHRFGEMALARAIEVWRAGGRVELITPDRYLDRHKARRPAELVERTSWSCVHGVERWRSDCGCRMEDVAGQDQSWRRPLRDVLDAVADVASRLFEAGAAEDFVDPWAARDAYGLVLGARPDDRADARKEFLCDHLALRGDPERAWEWLEAERLRLEAWSSCAWFFDSPERIETQQVLTEARASLERYAALTGTNAVEWFDRELAAAGLLPISR